MDEQVTPNFKDPTPRRRPRRRGVKPVSDRRAADRDRRDEVRAAVFARDRYCRLIDRADVAGTCRGPLTPHHLRKASAGGGYTEDNLVALCAGHNTWVEDEPDLAYSLGLVRRRGDA